MQSQEAYLKKAILDNVIYTEIKCFDLIFPKGSGNCFCVI